MISDEQNRTIVPVQVTNFLLRNHCPPALLLLPSPIRDRGLRTSTLCGSLGFLEATTLEAATLIGLAGWQDSAVLFFLRFELLNNLWETRKITTTLVADQWDLFESIVSCH